MDQFKTKDEVSGLKKDLQQMNGMSLRQEKQRPDTGPERAVVYRLDINSSLGYFMPVKLSYLGYFS